MYEITKPSTIITNGSCPSRYGHLLHVLEDMRVHLHGFAEELLDAVMTGEQLLEREAGEDRTRRQNADRDQHPDRALMRGFVVLLVVRLAEEGLEDQTPGIERRQTGRHHRQEIGVGRDGLCEA